jgi:hypothetical protein
MWFRDNAGNLITEDEFRWEPNPETGNMDSFGHGYEVVPGINAEWVIDGMQAQTHGPAVQWARVTKDHSPDKPPPLQWGFPDPDHPDEELSVPFKDKGVYWEAEHDCSNRYYPDRPEGEHMYQGPYFHYIMGTNDMVKGMGFVAGTGYKTAITYFKPSGVVDPTPDPGGDVSYFDKDNKEISKYEFNDLMGDAHILERDDLVYGETYLKITELWVREVEKPRYARLLARRREGDEPWHPMAGVPFKFFSEGVVFLEGLTNDMGVGELQLGTNHAYAVPGKGPLNLRIQTGYPLKAEQMRDYGLVRIHEAYNRHCDVVYEQRVWGEEVPVPPDPPDPPIPDKALLIAIIARLDIIIGLLLEIKELSE